MIKHIVSWRIIETANASKEENIIELKKRLLALPAHIQYIKNPKVYCNAKEANPDNFDIILMADFNNLEELKRYSIHPAHLELINFLATIRTAKSAVDFYYDENQ